MGSPNQPALSAASVPPAITPLPTALALCTVNWLVPGAGYLLRGEVRRGALLFLLLNTCFLIGLAHGGYYFVPAWNPRSPNFNIVACLTYAVQFFHGGGWMLSWLLEGAAADGNRLAGFLVGSPGATHSDLGVFHVLVAGGLNYFATVRLYEVCRGMGAKPQSAAAGEADSAEAGT